MGLHNGRGVGDVGLLLQKGGRGLWKNRHTERGGGITRFEDVFTRPTCNFGHPGCIDQKCVHPIKHGEAKRFGPMICPFYSPLPIIMTSLLTPARNLMRQLINSNFASTC